MKQIFCDFCGAEIKAHKNDNIFGLRTSLDRPGFRTVELNVEVKFLSADVGSDDVMPDICERCVLDGIAKLDNRPETP